METVPFLDAEFAALMSTLDELDIQVSADISLVEDKLPELRRLAKAESERRGGAGSRDANKYALGSVLVMHGLEHVGDTALLGLFAHSDLLLCWMIEARRAGGPQSFGALIERIFADPERHAFCRQWGRILQWRYRKPLYDGAVTSFIESGRTGRKEKWRQHDASDDQLALIAKLCDLLNEPMPKRMKKGEAFDWIHERGGNPAYWAEPEIPQGWSK